MELWIRKHKDKYDKLSDAEKYNNFKRIHFKSVDKNKRPNKIILAITYHRLDADHLQNRRNLK